MTIIGNFVKRHPVPIYFVLAYAVAWIGIVLVIGPQGLRRGTITFEQLLLMWLAMLAGSGGVGVLLTGVVDGRAGLRKLLAGMTRWRVGLRWYTPLLIVTLLATVILFVLSRGSPNFVPVIVAESNKTLLLGMFLMVAFGACVEELGWTGFAAPRLRLRHSALASGLTLGTLWGAWHFLGDFVGSRAGYGELFSIHFLAFWFVALTSYRVLIVWVYDHTGSLLLAQLMHAFYSAPLVVLGLSGASAVEKVLYEVLFTAALCVVAAVVVTVEARRSGRRSLQPQVT